MLRKQLIAVLTLTITIVSCSSAAAPPQTSLGGSPTTSTTLSSTTTTTLAPELEVDGAPTDMVAVLRGFYEYATGVSDEPPSAIPEVVESLPLAPAPTPLTGVASIGQFAGQSVATVEAETDLFLMVDDGSGWSIVGGKWPSLSIPPHFGGSPRLVLVVGSDARPGEDPASTRADSIHLAALDGGGAGALVGVPRDSWVSVPGVGNRKINASLAIGGPAKLVETFESMSGLTVEGYLLTGFVGFQEMLGNVLGGIRMVIPMVIKDAASGADFDIGEQYLNGPAALALARARKTLPGGDFTRSEHQGLIMIATAQTVRALGYGVIPRLMEMSEPWLLTDLTPAQLLTISAMLVDTDPANIGNVVLPGSPGQVGSASVVFVGSSAPAIWEDASDGHLDG